MYSHSLPSSSRLAQLPAAGASGQVLRDSGGTADIGEHPLMAATCLTSVSSDGQPTGASPTFEPQRRLCDVKQAQAGVSAIPGRDPLQPVAIFLATDRSTLDRDFRRRRQERA